MTTIDTGQKWLGAVPSTWHLAPLGTMFRERKETVSDTEFPALSVTKKGVVPQLEDVAKTVNNDSRKLVRAGDFVINSRSDRKGSSGVSALDGSVSVIYTVLQLRDAIYPPYAHHLLRSTAFQEEYYRWGTGIVADLWSTRYSSMKQILTALPPLDEQQAIADYLDRETQRIDELIAEQRGLIETLRERRETVIEHFVSVGVSGELLVKTSLPWVPRMPASWGVARMKHDTVIATGGTPDTDNLTFWAEEPDASSVPWVAISDMSQRKVVSSTAKSLTPAGVGSKRLSVGEKGTILFAMYASVGEVSRLEIPSTWNQAILGITPGERLDSGYLAYALISMRRFILGEVRTNTQANLNARQVGDVWLPCPPIREQREISAYLDDQTSRIDSLIAESEDLIALSQERRAALITAAVTGQIDVRTAA